MRTVQCEFLRTPATQKDVGGNTVYSAIASTAALDRDREILIPKGVILDNFLTNPVLLSFHQSRQTPVGKIINVKVTDVAVIIEFVFATDEESLQLEQLYKNGFMNAFSVGFLPRAYVPTYDLPDEVSSVEVTLPDGSSVPINFNDYPKRPFGIIPQWELLEVSVVSIPANPEALLLRGVDNVVKKYLEGGGTKAYGDILSHRLTSQAHGIADLISQFVKDTESAKISGVVEYMAGPVSEADFNVVDAIGALALEFSEGKTGESSDIHWAQFSLAFGWFDVEHANMLTGYEFCHHVIVDGVLHVSKAGVFDAMAGLLASSCPDKQSVYDHLAKHYQDLGVTPPELKEYTENELKSIAAGQPISDPDSSEPTASDEKQESPVSVDVKALTDQIGVLTSLLRETDATMKTRMAVVVQLIRELTAFVKELKVETPKEEPPADDSAKSYEALLQQLKMTMDQITA